MLVRAKEAFVASTDLQYSVVVSPRDIYDGTHPIVRAYPTMFVEVRATVDPIVEQATAAPGEKRSTRRPS